MRSVFWAIEAASERTRQSRLSFTLDASRVCVIAAFVTFRSRRWWLWLECHIVAANSLHRSGGTRSTRMIPFLNAVALRAGTASAISASRLSAPKRSGHEGRTGEQHDVPGKQQQLQLKLCEDERPRAGGCRGRKTSGDPVLRNARSTYAFE
jgi:hypothetical protein